MRGACGGVTLEVILGEVDGVVFGEPWTFECRAHQFQRQRQGQLGLVRFQFAARLHEEQVGQRDQTHVVMPARPTTGLVVRQAERSLGLFEELLHLKTRGGNQSERLERRRLVGVGEVVAVFGLFLQSPSDDHPHRRSRLLTADGPRPPAGELEDQRSLGPFVHMNHVPGGVGQACRQGLDRLGLLARLASRGHALPPPRWTLGRVAFRPHMGGGGHLDHVPLLELFQGSEKDSVMPVQCVGHEPVETHVACGERSLQLAHAISGLVRKRTCFGTRVFFRRARSAAHSRGR